MISIIILNYKSKGLTKNCIKSIYKHTHGLDFEIIVVDNDSNDGVGEMIKKRFKNVIFIQSGSNIGMGGGNNIGIKRAKGDFIAVLNPDIVIKNDIFKKLLDFMQQNNKVGIVAPQLLNPNGSLQYTRCLFPDLLMPVYRRTPLKKIKFIKHKIDLYLTKDKDYNQTTKADWIFGAFLFIRKSALDKVGLFDERFFLGFEDTDLARRFWNNGYEVWYYPKTYAIHYPHRFSQKNFFGKTVRIHIMSWFSYFKKYKFKRI